MALLSQVVEVKFTQGLDTKTQRKLVMPGKWDTLVNVSLAEDGSLTRRNGFEAILNGQAGNGLAVHGDELLVINGPDIAAVDNAGATRVARTTQGQRPHVNIDREEIIFNIANHDQPDLAYGAGYSCAVWRAYSAGGGTVTGIGVTLTDESTGTKVLNDAAVVASATAVSPRVVYSSGAFFIFYIDGTSVFCRTILTTAPSGINGAVAIVTDANLSSKNYDASTQDSQAGRCVVMYMTAAPDVSSVKTVSVSQTAGVPAVVAGPTGVFSAANVTEASICGVAVKSFGATAAVAGFYVLHTAGGALAGGLVAVVRQESAFAVTAGPANISATVPAVNGPCHVTATAVNATTMQIFFDQQSSYLTADIRPLQAVTASDALAVTVNQLMLRSATYRINAAEASGPQGPFICGKAFTSGSSTFLPVCMLENYNTLALGANVVTKSAQCSFYLLDTTNIIASITGTWNVAAGALYQTLGLHDPTLGGAAPTVGTPCSTPALASGFGVALQERGRLQLTNGFNTTPVGVSMITMTPQTTIPPLRVQLGESTFFEGGQIGNYDGKQISQHGFPNFPEGISAVVSAPGGGVKLTVGVHSIVAVYEWTDGAGNRHQSAPSLPVQVTVVNATDQINLLIPTTQLPQSAGYDGNISTLSIVCYMTTAAGVSFFRAITSFTPVANNVAASTVAYVIGAVVMTDAILAANELLYTQPFQAGATLPNVAPNPTHGIAVSQNRLWGWLSDEPGEYAFSQELLPNTGLQFNNDALGGRVPSEAGGGVAIAEFDEKTILFADRKLYAVFGNGPSPSGSDSNFTEPKPIPSDVGCAEARSVLLLPQGLIFKSAKGWYILGRDLVTRYVGEGVAQYDANSVSSAVLLEDQQEARFTSNDAEGPTLVFDYMREQWSVFYMGSASHAGSAADAIWWSATSRYVHLQNSTNGIFPGVMQETPGVYIDGAGTASPYQAFIRARTAFLHAAALESFQRVRWLYLTMTAATSPTNTMNIVVDFDDVYVGSSTPPAYAFNVNLTSLGTPAPSTQAIDFRHHMQFQKCKSVAFTFVEGGGATSTAAPITGIQAMALELGLKKGVQRLRAAQTF